MDKSAWRTSTTPTTTTTPSSTTTKKAEGSTGGKKVRKPYTITKSRERWSDEEHDKFLEGLQLFDRDWKKIEDFVGSKTVIQIRSHAQKYFMKVQKKGTVGHVPPPRPKHKASHSYTQKAFKNASSPYPPFINTIPPGYVGPWDDTSQDQFRNVRGVEGSSSDVASKDRSKQGKQVHVIHVAAGLPNFAQVYSFIGSIFDPDTKDHMQKLREMDPINFETVFLLMRNLAFNLSSPDFEPIRKFLSSYNLDTKTVGAPADTQTADISC